MPGRVSKLTHLEKVALRNAYVFFKGRGISFTPELKEKALGRVGCKIGWNRVLLLSAARSFISNSALRCFLPLKVPPFLVPNAIPRELLVSLQRYVKARMSPKYSLSKGESLSALIRSGKNEERGVTKGYVLDITNHENRALNDLENRCLDLLRAKLVEAGRSRRSNEEFLQEFDEQVDLKRLPHNDSLVWYRKDKVRGMTPPKDHWAMYGVVICVVFESESGNLKVDEIGLNGPLPEGSLVLINPTTLHEIPFTMRDSTRAVIVITM